MWGREESIRAFIGVIISLGALSMATACERRPRGCPDCPEIDCPAPEAPKPPKPCDAPITAHEQQWGLECIAQLSEGGYIDECVEAAAMIYRKCVFDL